MIKLTAAVKYQKGLNILNNQPVRFGLFACIWLIIHGLNNIFLSHQTMHVASGDQFVFFKVGGDRRDGSFFFYHVGYRMAGREERPKKKVAQKNSLTFSFFSCRRYLIL